MPTAVEVVAGVRIVTGSAVAPNADSGHTVRCSVRISTSRMPDASSRQTPTFPSNHTMTPFAETAPRSERTCHGCPSTRWST